MSCVPNIKDHPITGLVDINKGLTINELYGVGHAFVNDKDLVLGNVSNIITAESSKSVRTVVLGLMVPWVVTVIILIIALVLFRVFDIFSGILLAIVVIFIALIALSYIETELSRSAYGIADKIKAQVGKNVDDNKLAITSSLLAGYRGERCDTITAVPTPTTYYSE